MSVSPQMHRASGFRLLEAALLHSCKPPSIPPSPATATAAPTHPPGLATLPAWRCPIGGPYQAVIDLYQLYEAIVARGGIEADAPDAAWWELSDAATAAAGAPRPLPREALLAPAQMRQVYNARIRGFLAFMGDLVKQYEEDEVKKRRQEEERQRQRALAAQQQQQQQQLLLMSQQRQQQQMQHYMMQQQRLGQVVDPVRMMTQHLLLLQQQQQQQQAAAAHGAAAAAPRQQQQQPHHRAAAGGSHHHHHHHHHQQRHDSSTAAAAKADAPKRGRMEVAPSPQRNPELPRKRGRPSNADRGIEVPPKDPYYNEFPRKRGRPSNVDKAAEAERRSAAASGRYPTPPPARRGATPLDTPTPPPPDVPDLVPGDRLRSTLAFLRGASLSFAAEEGGAAGGAAGGGGAGATGPVAEAAGLARRYRKELSRLSSARCVALPPELYPLFGGRAPPRQTRPRNTRQRAAQSDGHTP
jgi:hypothetical protein